MTDKFDWNSESITALARSHDGQLLALGRRSGQIEVYAGLSHGPCLATWAAHHLHVSALVFDQKGTHLASASPDNAVVLWHWASATPVQTGKSLGGSAEALSFREGRLVLAVGFVDASVRLWDPLQSIQLDHWLGCAAHFMMLGFDRSGRRLSGMDRKRQLWQWQSGRAQATSLGTAQANVRGFAYLPEDQALLDADVWGAPSQYLLGHHLILILDDLDVDK